MHLKRLVFCGILATGLLTGLGLTASAHDKDNPVGLSLLFQNSSMAPVMLVGAAPRFLQEIDLVATVRLREVKWYTEAIAAFGFADIPALPTPFDIIVTTRA